MSEPASAGREAADWLAGATIYQIYLRSFRDASGDGIGDLRGAIEKLPHVAALGADAVWLSPFYASPMEDCGYDIADHCAVDPVCGSMADFEEFIAAAHGAGMKLVVDLVFSHTSDRHPWFAESAADRTNPKANWYVWADPRPDGTPPNNWLSAFGGSAWTWNRDREQYYLHDFLPAQPSLDFARAEVRSALMEVARFWRAKGVDGFRLDTMNSYFHDRDLRDNPPAPATESGLPRANPFAQQLHLYDRAQRGDLAPLADFLSEIERMGAATIVGRIGDRLKAERPGACSYTFVLPDTPFTAPALAASLNRALEASPDGRICWALSNHDTIRQVSRFAHAHADAERVATLCGALLAFLPGAISLYQGEELGLDEARLTETQLRDPYGIRFWPDIHGRDGCRTPMPWDSTGVHAGFSQADPWLPVQDRHVARAVDRQAADPQSVLSVYRQVVAARRRDPDRARGHLVSCTAEGEVLLLESRGRAGSFIGAFNLGATMQALPAAGAFADETPGARLIDGTLHLGPYEYAIMRRD